MTHLQDEIHIDANANPRGPGPRRGRLWRIAGVIAAIVIIGVGAFAVVARLNTPGSPVAQQPTATPAPKALYQSDWSHGADGWTLAPHWKLSNGALISDGSSNATIPIPYVPNAVNYTIEVQAQPLAVSSEAVCNRAFGILGETPTGAEEYAAMIDSLDNKPPYHGQSDLNVIDAQSSFGGLTIATADFSLGANSRTYGIEIHDKSATFLLNGHALYSLTSGQSLHTANLSIVDGCIQMELTSVTITTP